MTVSLFKMHTKLRMQVGAMACNGTPEIVTINKEYVSEIYLSEECMWWTFWVPGSRDRWLH